MTRAADIKAAFPTEAALCDQFIADMRALGGWTLFPETAGFDILAVYDRTGHQLGIEAKLALNAKVADQILPADYSGGMDNGPDFRAVIVPFVGEASDGIRKMLGILGVMVWTLDQTWNRGRDAFCFVRALDRWHHGSRPDRRCYDTADGPLNDWDRAWHDWNPVERCRLPEFVPDVRAGVPCPIQLTPWKIGALRVLADLEIDGYVTAKSVRERGVDARRFCASDGWLEMLGGGRWGRGKIPAFDQQHPEAYAQVLQEARAARKAAAA